MKKQEEKIKCIFSIGACVLTSHEDSHLDTICDGLKDKKNCPFWR